MRITQKDKEKLDLAFNESKINYVGIKSDTVEILMDCISMNSENKFPEDDRHKFMFSDFGRIAISYRLGEWDNEKAEIIKINETELKSKFDKLKLDSMYGWEYINLGDKTFDDWKEKLSLDLIKKDNWNEMNTIDLFAEQIGKDAVTIDIRIWFTDFQIFDYFGKEITKTEFVANAERGWNQLYKTGISSDNHKTKIIE